MREGIYFLLPHSNDDVACELDMVNMVLINTEALRNPGIISLNIILLNII